MSTELTYESLGLKKTLDKMTAKELRAVAMEKIPSIVGATGMGKDQLVSSIKEALGIVDEEGAVSPYKDKIFSLKREIRELRVKRETTEARNERGALRKKINKLKKRTRRLAASV